MAKNLLGKPEMPWLVGAVVATALLLGAVFLPLWRMKMIAPQYPRGLVMYAYGFKFDDTAATPYDDIRELNILNHYIGMKPIKEVWEMNIFIPGVALLATATLLSTLVVWRRQLVRALVAGGYWLAVLFFLADLQYWLYHYGHTLDPHAPIRSDPFTPKIMGSLKVWNFRVETGLAPGFYLLVGAALTITLLPLIWGRIRAWRARLARGEAAAGVPR